MYVFVYGSLKRGYHNHELLQNSEFICEAISKEKYPMVNIEELFPYLINEKGIGHNIKGEVFKIDEETLILLDILEGYPDFYTRETIKVVNMGIQMSAIVYFVNEDIEYKDLELLKEFAYK